MSQSLVDRYDDRIAGILSCYDRVVITGTLPGICYADGMTRYLNANGIRIFDYPQFAMKLRDRVRECAASLAVETGVTIEHFGKRHIRKGGGGRWWPHEFWSTGAITPAWCTSSRPWKPAMPINPGTTSRRTRHSSGRTAANAYTTIATSWMPGSFSERPRRA